MPVQMGVPLKSVFGVMAVIVKENRRLRLRFKRQALALVGNEVSAIPKHDGIRRQTFAVIAIGFVSHNTRTQ